MAAVDITDRVERLEIFEDRLDVRIEAVFASINGPDDDDEYEVQVNGELHKVSGTELEEDQIIELVLSLYDDLGRIRVTKSDYIYAKEFFGFQVFSFDFYTELGNPSRLRLIPKPC